MIRNADSKNNATNIVLNPTPEKMPNTVAPEATCTAAPRNLNIESPVAMTERFPVGKGGVEQQTQQSLRLKCAG